MRPTGGLVSGGTPVTLSGGGFDAFLGEEDINATLCRWGADAGAPVTSPASLAPNTLVCPAAPRAEGNVEVSIALNRVDFANLSLAYRYYDAPSFFSVGPSLGSSPAAG